MPHPKHLLSCILALAISALAAAAQAIPPTTGETFTGQQVSLPADLHGRSAIFVIGFTRNSRTQTTEWSKRLINTYGNNPAVAIYNLLPLDKVPGLMRGFVTRAVKKDVSDRAKPYFVVLNDHEKDWRSLVHETGDDSAYIVLCNPRGDVLWQANGPLSDAAFAALASHIPAH